MIRLLIRFALKLVREINGAVAGMVAVAVAINLAFPRTELHYLFHDALRMPTVAGQLTFAIAAVIGGFYIHRWLTRLLR